MRRIGLISDTHGYLDDQVFEFFKDCDEIWHGGDFGALIIAESLESFGKRIRPVLFFEAFMEILMVSILEVFTRN